MLTPAAYLLDRVLRCAVLRLQLLQVLKCPAAHTQLGDVHVWSGRPNWNERFAAVSAAHPSNTVGVTFCGNPLIAKDLRKQCFLTNKNRADNAHFKLHKVSDSRHAGQGRTAQRSSSHGRR